MVSGRVSYIDWPGSPAVVGRSLRPVALRPRLSTGLPLSSAGSIARTEKRCYELVDNRSKKCPRHKTI
jgi:hypothetical protein